MISPPHALSRLIIFLAEIRLLFKYMAPAWVHPVAVWDGFCPLHQQPNALHQLPREIGGPHTLAAEDQ